VREDFVRSQERKRKFISVGGSLALYSIAFLSFWLFGVWRGPNLDKLPSPVYISLEGVGTPERSPPKGPERPEAPPSPATVKTTIPKSEPPKPTVVQSKPATPAPAKPAAKVPTKPVPSKPTPVPAKSIPVPAPLLSPEPPAESPAKAPALATPSQPAEQAPAETSEPTPKPAAATETPFEPAIPALGPISSQTLAKPNAVYRSSEKGNSIDETFGAAKGQAGRNLYVPIYLYLPPPIMVDEGLFARIPKTAGYTMEARRELFLKYYQKAEGGWRLRSTVPLSERAELWLILEDAKYNTAKADFKTRGNLRPVTLRFTIAAGGGGMKPKLENLELVSSSGYADIDEAVLYGFRQSSYFNGTVEAVTGSFTYRFE